MSSIEPGQVYVAVKPSPSMPGEHHTRIRVVDCGPGYPAWGWSKTTVETVLPDGRGIRRRAIETTELHESATTKTGRPRRTGYVLEASR